MQLYASVIIAMFARAGKSIRSLLAAISALLLFVISGANGAKANGSDNLPIYTSPIDITGLKLQLRAVAPDRNTGKPVEISLPAGLLGPQMNALLSTPLSAELDLYWARIPDQKTGMTPRDNACKGANGVVQQVQKAVQQIGSSYSAYDISCNLASTGTLVAKQIDSTLYLGYLLSHNSVSFTATTP